MPCEPEANSPYEFIEGLYFALSWLKASRRQPSQARPHAQYIETILEGSQHASKEFC